jgi:hypothetical protein
MKNPLFPLFFLFSYLPFLFDLSLDTLQLQIAQEAIIVVRKPKTTR